MLDATQAAVAEERSSKKSPLEDADAAALLKIVDKILIARGKSTRTVAAGEATLDDLRGPTGGFRAPILRIGRTLLVGFSEPALRDLVG